MLMWLVGSPARQEDRKDEKEGSNERTLYWGSKRICESFSYRVSLFEVLKHIKTFNGTDMTICVKKECLWRFTEWEIAVIGRLRRGSNEKQGK